MDSATDSSLRIYTLGSFVVKRGGVIISNYSPRAQRMWKLLKYIVTYGDKPIPTDTLIEVLWPDEEVVNPIKALYSLIYRLRTVLRASEDAPEYILFSHNCYSWNAKAPCFIDRAAFEALIRQARAPAAPEAERIDLYRRALDLYQGDYLLESAFEEWVVPQANYLKRMYTQAVGDLCALYIQNQDYAAVIGVCEKAIEIDPLDELLHIQLISALIRTQQLRQAALHYDHIVGLLDKELGIQPSPELEALYREIHRGAQDIQADLISVQRGMREADAISRAFYCEFEIFRQLYRLEVRSMARSGVSAFLAMITVFDESHRVPDARALHAASGLLREVSLSSLRRGDVVSQYSKSQFIYLLPTLTAEDGEMVLQRLIAKFYKAYRGPALELTANLSPIIGA